MPQNFAGSASPSPQRVRSVVIFIAKAAFGGADAFAPIAAELKRDFGDRIAIVVLFLDRRARREVASSTFHEALFTDLAMMIDLSRPPSKSRWFAKLWKGWKLLSLLAGNRFRGRRVSILYPLVGRDWRERALIRFFEIFGRHYWLPSIQLPWNEHISARQRPEMLSRLVKADTGRDFVHQSHQVRRAICYTSRDTELIDAAFAWNAQFIPIGIPRLYPGWLPAAAHYGNVTLSHELAALGLDAETPAIATIILTNPRYIWFDGRDVFSEMVADIRAEIACAFPGMPVLLKSKPVFDNEYDRDLRDPESPQPARLTTLGLGALALRTRIAVTVNESSGFFDFTAAGVPVVEYSRYNKRWRDLTGIGSAWEGTPGLVSARSREDLRTAIADVAAGSFPILSRERIAASFGHKKNLEVFGG